jgi:hypothetical protein
VLELQPLRTSQYWQVAQWEFGDDADLKDYTAKLEAPDQFNFGVYLNGQFCAAIAIERFDSTTRFHVVEARRFIHPQQMADLLITIADYLYQNGIEELEAVFLKTNRAARRLAIRSWMTPKCEYKHDGFQFQVYAITKKRYYEFKDKVCSDSFSARTEANQHV